MIIPRNLFLAVFLACTGLLVTAIYVEPFASMNPCPMCMMQRGVFAAIGIIALIGFLHNAQDIGWKIYSVFIALISLLGAAIAARQVWLQNLPEDQVPACGPGLEYMIEVFPLFEVIEMALLGTGDCAEVQWTFLSLSIPGWSLLTFAGMTIACITLLFVYKSPQK